MKVLLCSINSKYIHSTLAPWYLAAGVDAYCKSDIELDVLEGTINQPDGVLLEKILAYTPDVLAFSCYIWNITMVGRLISAVKEKADIKIILGGPEVSYNALELLTENKLIDYIISGEGEMPFAKLLDCLSFGSDIKDIPGLCFRDGNTIKQNRAYLPDNEPVSPYTKKYFDSLNGRIAYLETSRGCPFSCSFCLSSLCEGARFFDTERAKTELLALANSGAQTVKLVDRTFNCNKKRAYELFKFIIDNKGKYPEGIRFHFEVAADLFDEQTLELLSTAPKGLFQFEAGLQSFNEQTLEAVNRKTDIKKLCDNLKKLISGGNIHIHIDLIAGLPFEDIKSFENSFNLAYSLYPHMLQLGFLKLLHGSKIREQAGKFGYKFVSMPPYEVKSSKWISSKELNKIHAAEDALERLYNSGRFALTLDFLLEATQIKPFDLFLEFGLYVIENITVQNISLDRYSEELYKYFGAYETVDKYKLRDIMVCDRLSCDNTGKLPDFLRVADSRLKKITHHLKNQNGRFGAAILYTGGERIATADYTKKDPITGRYGLKINKFSDFNFEK